MSADVDGSDIASVDATSSSLSVMSTHSVLGWSLLAPDGMASVGWLFGSEVEVTLIPSSREKRKKYKLKLEVSIGHYFTTLVASGRANN